MLNFRGQLHKILKQSGFILLWIFLCCGGHAAWPPLDNTHPEQGFSQQSTATIKHLVAEEEIERNIGIQYSLTTKAPVHQLAWANHSSGQDPPVLQRNGLSVPDNRLVDLSYDYDALRIAVPPSDAPLRGADNIKVLGRLDDTAVAKSWSGHDVLDIPDWTLKKNMKWMDDGIANKQTFYTGSPTKGNMIQTSGPYKGQSTVFAQEIQRLEASGYKKVGDYLVHPDNAATFIP